MVKLCSVVLIFVIYWLLSIYEGILMSALPMVAHCQYACKRFALSVQLYCLYNSSHQSIPTLYARKKVTKVPTLLYTAVHGLPL